MTVKWVTDQTGRFRQRPHYQPGEIDEICEDAVTSFLLERHGTVRYPVTTEDLTVLIERSVEDFDNGCDLDDGLKKLFDGKPREHHNRCHRDDIEGRNGHWIEWQAAYASGALLMPASALTRAVRAFREAHDVRFADIGVDTPEGAALIADVMKEFQVSQDAARVRLSQRRAIVEKPEATLF